MAIGDDSNPTADTAENPGDGQDSPTPPESGRTVTCLCLKTFTEDKAPPHIHLTPPKVVDPEGRTEQTSMVCCNECWMQMPMFQRSLLSVLTTDARDGGLGVGRTFYERFWPEMLRPFVGKPTPLPDDDFEDVRESGPPMAHPPVGSPVSEMIDQRNASRRGGGHDE